MEKNTSLRTLVIISSFIIMVNCQIDRDLLTGVNNMIGSDVNTGSILGQISSGCSFYSRDLTFSEFEEVLKQYQELTIIGIPTFVGDQIVFSESIKVKIYPNEGMTPLKFGQNTRIDRFRFEHNIQGTKAWGYADALVAVRTGNTVKYRIASSYANAELKDQFTFQSGQKIKRGLYPNELLAMNVKLEREATIAMKNKVMQSTGLKWSQLGISSAYTDEVKKIRTLFPDITYDYSTTLNVEKGQLSDIIQSASKDKITDANIRLMIGQVAATAQRSNFFVVPNTEDFFVISLQNMGTYYTMNMSSAKVKGKRLPVGAFATSVGTWKFEKAGEGSSPSANQIISLFSALR